MSSPAQASDRSRQSQKRRLKPLFFRQLTKVFGLLKLTTTDSLKLYVPLSGKQRLVLQIPASVVTEWQWLVTDLNS
ncbi:MAG: DUF3122 domain-containing protein [Hassallia sp. WJT32-NPBG1]|nr:DUF3122 domain-containing protein [Hassallia sp. WJT32-NPBG1]